MDRLRAIFSRQNLPKILLLAGFYLLGRMEGEGRFTWGDVLAKAWKTTVTVGASAADSAKGVAGF
jgi:hypothetical protein